MIDIDRDFARMRDYLAGRLPDNDRRTFEDRLQRDPDLVRELELSLKLREGLLLSRNDRQHRRRNAVAGALAAAAALAGISLLLWMHMGATSTATLHSASDAIASGKAGNIVAHFSFIGTRSADIPDLNLPTHGLIELRAAPSRRSSSLHYSIGLERRATAATLPARVDRLTGLALDADGFVHFYAEAARLEPGQYDLYLKSDSGADAVTDEFMFSLVRGDAPISSNFR